MKKILFGLACAFALAGMYAVYVTNNKKSASTTTNKQVESLQIIRKINDVDVDQDGKNDEILLYYKSSQREVGLQIKDAQAKLLTVESEKQIFNPQPSDQYVFQLFTEGNKILVGVTYSHTNKYGSTSKIDAYEYKDHLLSPLWSSDDELQKRIIINSYNEEVISWMSG
ncbi:hypothetical protein [Paenibacillus sp. N3.4]|uniref:hypothetical protein n=1 Tax=Paenibacillus sp. N3.4 TaxID=2603222 RepID=UPI0011C86E2F|nr:hypothetical protein [Paenibacillus sp. N3.4]TXK84140.1 hypothetical protein FU659_09805 [Paenibacillus sp. N3.4]